MGMLRVINNLKVRLHCNKDKHNWEYCTWGSAPVDNLDDTFGFWSIPTRICKDCKKHQFKLKNGWEIAKEGLTIKDLK